MEFRPAVLPDLPDVTEVVKQAYKLYIPRMDREPAQLSADYAGAIRAGHVHGATDPNGGEIDPLDKDSIRVADIHTTIQHALGIDYAKELMTPISRPMALSNGRVIKTLLKQS